MEGSNGTKGSIGVSSQFSERRGDNISDDEGRVAKEGPQVMDDLSSEKRVLLDELMDRGLATARLVVGGLRQEGMGPEMEMLTAEAGKALRELETAVQLAQREAMADLEPRKSLVLSRLQQYDKACKALKAELRQAVKSVVTRAEDPKASRDTSTRAPTVSSTYDQDKEMLLRRRRRGSGVGEDEDKGRDLLREPQDITQSLQRTRALMAQELDRLSNVVQVMDDDGETILEAYGTHDSLKARLGRADALLRKLKRQEQLDRMVKYAAITFYSLTVAFILLRRVWIPFLW